MVMPGDVLHAGASRMLAQSEQLYRALVDESVATTVERCGLGEIGNRRGSSSCSPTVHRAARAPR